MSAFFKYKLDHILFWSATVLFHMYTRWPLIGQFGLLQFVLEIVLRNVLLAAIIYLNLRVLIPRFARSCRWLFYGVALLVAVLGYALLKDLHDLFLYGNTAITDSVVTKPVMISQTFYNISIAIFYVSFSVALQLSREWVRQRELLQQIAYDQVKTELAYLKSQINPHFLFNSINTIYFQIDKENRVAREMLSTFADMLRYQLYECNGPSISIEKEAAYLRNYVDLQRMRKDGHYNIHFSAGPNVSGFQIAPLLLLPFVENAFKHVSNGPNDNAIEISLDYREPTFTLVVVNTCENESETHRGIGLQNVKRRLELLYPGKYTLTIDRSKSHYRVQLNVLVDAPAKEWSYSGEIMKVNTH